VSEFNVYTVLKFKAEDIIMDQDTYSFELRKIVEARTTVHNIIGEPIPYEDYKKKVKRESLRGSRPKLKTKSSTQCQCSG
jgi:hypothetical protein